MLCGTFLIDTDDNKKAVCMILHGDRSAKNFTTTNLIAHLRSQHAVGYREYQSQLTSKDR